MNKESDCQSLYFHAIISYAAILGVVDEGYLILPCLVLNNKAIQLAVVFWDLSVQRV